VETKTSLIVPMDQGVIGYFAELEDPREIIKGLAEAGVNAFLLRRGLANLAESKYIRGSGLVLRITFSTSLRGKRTEQAYTSTVEEALRLGADAVAATVHVGSEREIPDLTNLGLLADACDKWSLPLLGEAFPKETKTEPSSATSVRTTIDEMRQALRVVGELGVDFVKTRYTGDFESFREIVRYSLVPVLIAGGPITKNVEDTLRMVEGAMKAGAAGICMGRKIWAYENPPLLARALQEIIRKKMTAEEAAKGLK
jgi:DhnA family fructose-bisphosphate aldolase class Ia